MDLTEKKIKSEEIFKGVLLHVTKDIVELPNGNTSTREMIHHVGAVCMIPLTEDGKIVVERQFRYPIGRTITEIPAGKLDSHEEDRLEAAKRELREETGLSADKWTNLGDFFPASAYCNEKLTIFLCEGLHQGEQELDPDEFLQVEEVPLETLVQEVMTGVIIDPKTIISVLKVDRILKQRKKEAEGQKVKTNQLLGEYVGGKDIPLGCYDFIVGGSTAHVALRKSGDFETRDFYLARYGGALHVRLNVEDGDRFSIDEPVICVKAGLLDFEEE